MKEKKDDIVKKLTKKYYLKLTNDCIELSPEIEDCFEIRRAVAINLATIIIKERRLFKHERDIGIKV